MDKTTNKSKHGRTSNKNVSVAVLVSVLVFASGCSTIDKEKVRKDFSALGSKISSGVNSLKTKGPSRKSRKANSAVAIAAKYPTNEVPHTLMRKPVAEGRLTSGHGYRLSPTGIPLPRKHKGVDYAAPKGTAIFAAGDGTIDRLYTSKSYGNYISIQHENDFRTAYAHMDDFASGLEVGSEVKRGQTIGFVGTTGRSSGDHLHFELIHRGNFIDPLFESEPQTVAAE